MLFDVSPSPSTALLRRAATPWPAVYDRYLSWTRGCRLRHPEESKRYARVGSPRARDVSVMPIGGAARRACAITVDLAPGVASSS